VEEQISYGSLDFRSIRETAAMLGGYLLPPHRASAEVSHSPGIAIAVAYQKKKARAYQKPVRL
jgi:hypothetical protein